MLEILALFLLVTMPFFLYCLDCIYCLSPTQRKQHKVDYIPFFGSTTRKMDLWHFLISESQILKLPGRDMTLNSGFKHFKKMCLLLFCALENQKCFCHLILLLFDHSSCLCFHVFIFLWLCGTHFSVKYLLLRVVAITTVSFHDMHTISEIQNFSLKEHVPHTSKRNMDSLFLHYFAGK